MTELYFNYNYIFAQTLNDYGLFTGIWCHFQCLRIGLVTLGTIKAPLIGIHFASSYFFFICYLNGQLITLLLSRGPKM